MSNVYYHRINSKSAERFRVALVRDFGTDVTDTEAHVQSLMSHRTPLSTGRWAPGDENISIECAWFKMKCTDGVLRDIKTWFDEDGDSKCLIPNLRANAIIDAARFSSAERVKFLNNTNQTLKDHQGCNFVFGDLVCELPVGVPPPDHDVYGNNPLWAVTQPREPSAEMIADHGRDEAVNKLSPTRKLDIVATHYSGRPVWRDTTYFVAPRVCRDIEFKTNLELWGVTEDELRRLFPAVEEPQEYATIMQFTREWSLLTQTEKDAIWRLQQRPGTTNSACYTRHGAEVTDAEICRLVFGDDSQTRERLDIIRVMKSWEEPPSIDLFYSLQQLEDSITTTYPRSPALIYFHHNRNIFMYMLGRESEDSDEGSYRDELRNLRRALRAGKILSVVEGQPLTLGGRELFTMEVEFKNIECHPYFLLRRDGNMNHSAKTPYFFLVHETGANAIAWINQGIGGGNPGQN